MCVCGRERCAQRAICVKAIREKNRGMIPFAAGNFAPYKGPKERKSEIEKRIAIFTFT